MSIKKENDGWFKSSDSGDDGNCVEVRHVGDGVELRHSKDPAGAKLSFTGSEWDAFLAGAAKNEFKRP